MAKDGAKPKEGRLRELVSDEERKKCVEPVGWGWAFCETHRFAADQNMGFAVLNPSYELSFIYRTAEDFPLMRSLTNWPKLDPRNARS
jgi:hypothetical protein